MAQVKITDLAAYADPVSTDVLPVVDVTADTTKKVSIATLLKNASLGTAALPGIAFDGDPNTGLYSPGADQVAISTAGTGKLFVDASGKVGIGTSSPGYTLDVAGVINANATVRASNGTHVGIFGSEAFAAGVVGLGSGSNHPLVLGTNSMERLRITSAGLVGVGTSAPETNLDVRFATSPGTDNGGGYNALRSFTTSALAVNTGGALSLGGVYHSNGAVAAFGQIAGRKENATSNDLSGYLQFATNTGGGTMVERVRIDAAGRVGINTTSPSQALSVAGNISSSAVGTNYVASSSQGVTTSYLITDTSGANIQVDGAWPIRFTTNSGERARIDSSGRLLVGTSSAQGTSIFQAVGNSAASTDPGDIRIIRGVGVSSIGGNVGAGLGCIGFGALENTVCATIEAQSDATWSSTSNTPGRLVFSTTADGASSPTERMRIKSNGQVLVAHGTSASVIQAESSITSGYANSIFVARFTGYSPNETGNYFFYGEDTTGPRAYIRSNGGLVNYQANDVNLSDRNAKKDISPAAGTWDCIKGWEIVNYRYKDQPDNADLNLGVIAQQVAESCPEVITIFEEAKDDQPEKLGVKEQQMYWMAIKALQEAQVRIEALEAEVAALKAQ